MDEKPYEIQVDSPWSCTTAIGVGNEGKAEDIEGGEDVGYGEVGDRAMWLEEFDDQAADIRTLCGNIRYDHRPICGCSFNVC
jgi:hypothetical protein